jgi:hypothetical protein
VQERLTAAAWKRACSRRELDHGENGRERRKVGGGGIGEIYVGFTLLWMTAQAHCQNPTRREAPVLPIRSLHFGTSVGAPAILLSSNFCRRPIETAGVSPKSRRCPNRYIGRRIGSADEDGLNETW